MTDHDTAPSLHAIIQHTANALMPRYHDHALCTDYAWWMVQAITQQSRAQLLTASPFMLTKPQRKTLETWIVRQLNDKIPLAYLIGSVPFASLDILIEPPFLIPRQETEEWTTKLIELLTKNAVHEFSLLDLCTGSGCIALAIAHAFPRATIYASDISEQALNLARKNKAHNQSTNITFIQSDLFHALQSRTVDIIVSNPPYIAHDEWLTLDPAVKDWEDTAALVAPQEGLGIIKTIITNARAHLKINDVLHRHQVPQLWLEIGHQQGAAVQALMHAAGFTSVTVHKDLRGKDRIVTGCLPS